MECFVAAARGLAQLATEAPNPEGHGAHTPKRHVDEDDVMKIMQIKEFTIDVLSETFGLSRVAKGHGAVTENPERKKVSRETSFGSLVQEISAVATTPGKAVNQAGATTPEKLVSSGSIGAPGGLAARRRMMGLSAVNTKLGENMEKGDIVASKRNSIKILPKGLQFSDFYTMGSEVMPSSNTGMDVLFAKRKRDGMEMVIKTRRKACSFMNKKDEEEWRGSTEMLMNLPASDNIAHLHEVLEDDLMYYVVMEKVEGMDLFEVLQNEGGLPIGETKAILRQLLQAVQDLHSRGCIHKDLKLENVMVDMSPKYKANSPKSPARFHDSTGVFNAGEELSSPTVVKLIDFDTVEKCSPKNKARTVVGTDQYIAQEAYAGHYSPASDIFSVGVIAYKLVSGKFPFKNAMFDDKPGENYVGSPKMKIIQDRLNHFHISFDVSPWQHDKQARDLVRWMLQNNENDRPTATQALQHAFFEPTGMTPALPKNVSATWR